MGIYTDCCDTEPYLQRDILYAYTGPLHIKVPRYHAINAYFDYNTQKPLEIVPCILYANFLYA